MTDEETESRIRFGIADDRAITPEWYWRKQIEELEATQTRWVKCSERMPPKPGQYFILEKIHTTAGLRLAVAMGKTEGWITHDRDDVVAWLENVPEFVP